ncbi:hypothetical protein Bbelb_167800 [Branchiostoma belcheri]|nr:hypothetical protein Bbelb_167800 [Branchiostoma belcheri]
MQGHNVRAHVQTCPGYDSASNPSLLSDLVSREHETRSRLNITDQESRKAHRKIKEAVHIQLERAGMNRNEGWEPKSYLPLLRKEAGECIVNGPQGTESRAIWGRQIFRAPGMWA